MHGAVAGLPVRDVVRARPRIATWLERADAALRWEVVVVLILGNGPKKA